MLRLHGRNEEKTEDTTLAILLHPEVLRHGPEIVPVEMTIVVETLTTVVVNKATMLPLPLLQLVAILRLGHKQLLHILPLRLDMVATLHQAIPAVAILLSNLWVRHLASRLLLD